MFTSKRRIALNALREWPQSSLQSEREDRVGEEGMFEESGGKQGW